MTTAAITSNSSPRAVSAWMAPIRASSRLPAKAAVKPTIIMHWIFTRSARMPDSVATIRLAPTA